MHLRQALKRKLAFMLLTNKSFRFFRSLGVHVTPVHFYSPIPDLRELMGRPEIWEQPSALIGVEMNSEEQRRLMVEVFAAYQSECDFPRQATTCAYEYHTDNVYLGYVSAASIHCLVRHFRPRQIIEVGAGFSTRVLARAARMNAEEGNPVDVIAVDPFPSDLLRAGFPGLSHVIDRKVEDVGLEFFAGLRRNDILLIDSTHAIRTGGDVVYLYLEVLPRLASGVIVGIHDIFLPYSYPQAWLKQRYFWNEQYLLHAYLAYNQAFSVLWGQRFAEAQFSESYAAVFRERITQAENCNSYCFWLMRNEWSPRC
jgi:hypothetical protein